MPRPTPSWTVGTTSHLRGLRHRTFRSLQDVNFRRYLLGHAVSIIGTWMQRVAQDWLVLSLTHSGVALGVAGALQFGPTLVLGIWGGALVDRLDRRRLLIGTQAVQAALAAVLAALTLAHMVSLAEVYVLALCLGLVTVVDALARQALVGEMTGPDDYVNAQALTATVHNAGRLVGPAFAGLLIATSGVGAAFAVNTVSFAAVLVALLRMDPSAMHRTVRAERGKGSALEGLRYVASSRRLTGVLVLVGVVGLFGQNFRVVLPLVATDTFHGGASTYGWLTAALGAGAVLGALVSASRTRATATSVGLACLGFGVANLLAALAPNLGTAYAAMVVVGFANIVFNTLARTVLQVGSERSMHGRVLALHGLVFLGTTPLGGPLLGWVCELAGARWGLVVAALTAVAAGVWQLPRLRDGDPPATSGTTTPVQMV